MKLSLEEKTKLISLSEKASDLLVEILSENNPKEQIATERDKKIKNIFSQIHHTCPLLADGYIEMYNYIQKVKSKEEKLTYLKRLRKEDFGNIEEGDADIIY